MQHFNTLTRIAVVECLDYRYALLNIKIKLVLTFLSTLPLSTGSDVSHSKRVYCIWGSGGSRVLLRVEYAKKFL